MFPVTYFDIMTNSDRKCNALLLGDYVSIHCRLMMKYTLSSLKALEDYLNKCDDEVKFHDINPKMLDDLYESQEESTQLFNNTMKLIEKINKIV